MNSLAQQVFGLSTRPECGSPEYTEWLTHSSFVRFLQRLPSLGRIPLCASIPNAVIYGVLVPRRKVTPPKVDDLLKWKYVPFSSWNISVSGGKCPKVELLPPLSDTGSNTLERGEWIILRRDFGGRQDAQSYFELSQKVSHVLDLHYVKEREAFCRFDTSGDLEEVVSVTRNPSKDVWGEEYVVTMARSALDEYMTLTKQALVLLYDSTRHGTAESTGWEDGAETCQGYEPEIFHRMVDIPGDASYIRGFQIVRTKISRRQLLKLHDPCDSRSRRYATFETYDWKHDRVCQCSCDPKYLGNYFVKSDLPYDTSPVFFRPEVLTRYKADPDKYRLQDRQISCPGIWSLQTYDINEAGQVHTYLKCLGHLPYEEQRYWREFNEAPKEEISRRAFRTDFAGEWDDEYDALRNLKAVLRELDAEQATWWKLRDPSLVDVLNYPVTASTKEWKDEIEALHKLIVEGFDVKGLRSCLTDLGEGIDKKKRSLDLLEEILRHRRTDEEAKEVIKPFRDLNKIRNEICAHASGDNAKRSRADILERHRTLPEHFRCLCGNCDKMIRMLRDILVQ